MKLIKEIMSNQDFIELQKHQFEEDKKATNNEYPGVHKASKNIHHKPKKIKFWNYR